MNLISLVRNDDRLIHGQCMVRLVQHFKLSRIIVVDDMTATNSILKMVFEKAAMPGMTINVYTHENCIEPIKAAIVDNVSTMVVFRFPTTAKVLFDKIPDLPKHIMVGPCQMRPGCKTVMDGCYVSEEEIKVLKELAEERGVEVYFQAVPDMQRLDWKDVKNKLA
ncbi:MAG: PTS system mannose/fructose/N-acetylgalactosamine-transporter subunit IIB [Erysipelotrichaceae bacterium]|jgi:mannose/fructose/N-acetylgalactosamine-specific phosphotransferase system component IIB